MQSLASVGARLMDKFGDYLTPLYGQYHAGFLERLPDLQTGMTRLLSRCVIHTEWRIYCGLNRITRGRCDRLAGPPWQHERCRFVPWSARRRCAAQPQASSSNAMSGLKTLALTPGTRWGCGTNTATPPIQLGLCHIAGRSIPAMQPPLLGWPRWSQDSQRSPRISRL